MEHEFDIRRIEILDDATVEMYRRLDGAARLQIAGQLFESAWNMITAGVRDRYPSWTEEQVRSEVVRRYQLAAR